MPCGLCAPPSAASTAQAVERTGPRGREASVPPEAVRFGLGAPSGTVTTEAGHGPRTGGSLPAWRRGPGLAVGRHGHRLAGGVAAFT